MFYTSFKGGEWGGGGGPFLALHCCCQIGGFLLGDKLKEKFTEFTQFTSDERPSNPSIKMHAGNIKRQRYCRVKIDLLVVNFTNILRAFALMFTSQKITKTKL